MDLLKRVFANVVHTIVPESFINRNRTRKRSAENFEPELTDDEEISDSFYLNRKRMRSAFDSGPHTSSPMRVYFEKAQPTSGRDERKLPLQQSQNVPIRNLDDDVIVVSDSSRALPSPKVTVCFPSSFKKNSVNSSMFSAKKEMKKKRVPLFERFKRNNYSYSSSAAANTRADTVRLAERNEYMQMINELRRGTFTSLAASFRNFRSSSFSKNGNAPLVQSKTSVPELIAKQSTWFNAPNVAYNGPFQKATIQNLRTLNYSEEEIKPLPVDLPKENRVIETIDITQDTSESISSGSKGNGVINTTISTPARFNFRTPSRTTSTTSSKFESLDDQIHYVFETSFGTKENPIELKDDDNEVEEVSFIDAKNSDDEDVQIVSPHILGSRPVNSLSLDLKASPFTSSKWLTQQKSSRAEARREREIKIEREQKKLDILKNESTIEQDLLQGIRRNLVLTDIIILEKPEEKLPEIDESMLAVIHRARAPGRGLGEVITTTPNNIQITKSDIKSLAPMQWLNDNVISSYLDMIALRSKTSDKWPSVYVFTTFFYPKYLNEGYSNILKRWTRKVDIFSYDLLIFPIHLGIHWCLATADLRNKTIKYYDSLGGKNFQCVKALLQYLGKEHEERKKTRLMETEWKTEIVEDIPHQQNGSDCGMFACKFAEYLSRDAELKFKQEDMNYYRERMIYEIITQDLLYP